MYMFIIFFLSSMILVVYLFLSSAWAEIISKRKQNEKWEFYVHYCNCKHSFTNVIDAEFMFVNPIHILTYTVDVQ